MLLLVRCYGSSRSSLTLRHYSNLRILIENHNYELEVGITGEIDPETGFLIDLKILKNIIKEEVEDPFDHKNLNLEVPEFETLNPTVENIAMVIWNKLSKRLGKENEITVKLYETQRNFVVYTG